MLGRASAGETAGLLSGMSVACAGLGSQTARDTFSLGAQQGAGGVGSPPGSPPGVRSRSGPRGFCPCAVPSRADVLWQDPGLRPLCWGQSACDPPSRRGPVAWAQPQGGGWPACGRAAHGFADTHMCPHASPCVCTRACQAHPLLPAAGGSSSQSPVRRAGQFLMVRLLCFKISLL